MRVAIVSEYFPPVTVGGAEVSAHRLATALAERPGVDVEVITVDYGPRLKDPPFPVHYLRLPRMPVDSQVSLDPRQVYQLNGHRPFASPTHHAAFAWRLGRLAAQRDFDVIHTQQVDSNLAAYLAAPLHRTPMVTTVRGYRYLAGRWHDEAAVSAGVSNNGVHGPRRVVFGLKWVVPRRALRHCVHVIAVSNFVRDSYVDAGVVKADYISTIYNVPPMPTSLLVDRPSLRRRLGFDGQTVLFAGRLTKGKGVFALVEAMARVMHRLPEARLMIAGGGDVSPLRSLSAQMGISGGVRFAGFVDNHRLLEMIAAADVVAVPSLHHEPLSRVLLEAIALDRPVVATPVGGTPEVIAHGLNGYVASGLSIDALAESLMQALCDHQLPARTTSHNLSLRRTTLNPNRLIDQVVNRYERAIV